MGNERMAMSPNPDQKKAIEAPHDQPVRIVAGAGTGKTEVISRRYVQLLSIGGLRPDQILVLTFSDKAAAEMRARIFRAVSTAGLGYERLALAGAAISTFHSFGSRLLRDHSLLAGIDTALPFLTEADTTEILDRAAFAFVDAEYKLAYTFNPLDKDVYRWDDGGPIKTAATLISQICNQGVTVRAFRAGWEGAEALSDRHAVLAPLITHLYQAYQTELERRGRLDFDRLITGAARLIEDAPDLRKRLQETYRAILVDEYQDTNYAQENLLRALAMDGMTNVTVVGDPRQAIYVWREARVENIAGFPGTGGTRMEAPLSQNWRSVQPILEVANRAIEGYEFGDQPEFDRKRVLETARPETERHQPAVLLQTFETREAEAEAIAVLIERYRQDGHAYGDMAILIRARTYLDTYLAALERSAIPFQAPAGDTFYSRPEVMQTIHLLRVIINPLDTLALAVTLLSPVVGLSQAELARLVQADNGPLWAIVTDPSRVDEPRIAERLQRFTALWERAQREKWLRSPASFVGWVLPASGLEAYIRENRTLNAGQALSKLLAVSHVYEAEHPGDTLNELTVWLRQLVQTEPREKTPELTGTDDSVVVLTAHASKGLEFPVVFAIDNRQRLSLPQRKAPFHEPGHGLVFPEENAQHPHALVRERHARNEARCLWYVTLTRAKEQLVLTASDARNLEVKDVYNPARTFFQELWNHETARPSAGVERRRE